MLRSKLRMTFFYAVVALLLHLLPGGVDPSRAQSSRKDDIIFNSRGIPLAGASVRVCAMPASGQPCSPLAQIYSDSALTQALANPTTTDGLGNYFFYAAPGKYMIEISGPGITTKQIPNVILPNDPTAPTFSTVSSTGAISAFSLTLTGNLTVNGSTVVLGNLASGTLNLSNQSTPPGAASAGTVNLYTKSADKKLYYKDETGAETGPLGSGGGGGNPGGNNGDLQSKNGSSLQASGLNDNGATVVINRDQQSAGPNPWFDIRSFGATISSASTTGSISSGSPTLTLASAQDFANGQGVIVYGAGSATTLTTPGTPTVTPNLSGGATTWNYKVIAEDYKGGLTAASAVGTTAAGSSALGLTSFTITTATRTNGVTTYTTSVPHNLSPGQTIFVCQFGGGACPGAFNDLFNGTKTVASTPSSTTFTTLESGTTTYDGSETPTAGQGWVKACNTVTFPAGSFSGPGTLRYWIYRSQGSGAYSIAGVAIGLDPFFVDCGGNAPNAPFYVPATPPSAPQAGYLATTISSGGGTTSLTLAGNAGATVSSTAVTHDNSSALLAAMNAAANQSGGTVYIPSVGPGIIYWAFNAATDMNTVSRANNNYITILINGNIALGNPWILRGNVLIQGMTKRNSSFMYPGGANFGSLSAYPLFYIKTKNSITLRNLFLNANGAQSTGLFTDTDGGGNGSNGIILENVGLANGSNGGVGTARNAILKGGFDYSFRQVTCDPSTGNSTYLPAPCIDFTDSSTAVESTSQIPGRVAFDYSYINNSGIRVTSLPNGNYGSGTGYRFTGMLAESMLTPFLRVGPMGFTDDFDLNDVLMSDQVTGTGTPIVDASGSQLQGVSVTGGVSTGGGGQPVLISSYPGTNLVGTRYPTQNAGNTPWFATRQQGGSAETEVNNEPLNLLGSGRVNYAMAAPGAPSSCVVSSAGNVPAGTHQYTLTAVDFDGNETIPGPPAFVTTTAGNQTVTCNLPSPPAGAKGFNPYRDSFRAQVNGCAVPQIPPGTTSFTDALGFGCGGSAPQINSAGSSFVSSSGVSTYQLRLNGAALTGATGSGNLATTSRGSFVQGHLPTFDANGNLLDAGVSPTNVTDFFNRAAGNLGSEPSSPWTIEAGTLLVTAGGVGGNTSGQNYAVFTGVGFPNDDQSVSSTWVKTGTPSVQSNSLVLRGSPTALTNYLCSPSSNGSSLTIGKFLAGTFTSLASQTATINNGDIVSFNVTGASLNCYVNGVPVVSATDSSIASGFPGLGAFQTYNANSANLQWKNWMASPGYVSLQRPQTWNASQTFASGISIGGGLAGQIQTATGTTASAFQSAGINDCNGGSPVTTTPYLLQADSAASILDRSTVCRLQSGASVINIPSSTAAGMTNHFSVVLIDDGAGTVTVQRNTSSTDTFSLYTGSLATTGATSFTLTNGQSATLTQGAAGIWEVRLITIGTVANGTATMTTAAISSGACGATVTVAAAGVSTTDVVSWSYNAAPAANPGQLVISAWPTAGNVNFQYCNPAAGSITPNAATLNWKVAR